MSHACLQDTQVIQWLPGLPLCSSELTFIPANSSSILTWVACPDGYVSLSPSNDLVFPQLPAGQAVQIPVRPLQHVPAQTNRGRISPK